MTLFDREALYDWLGAHEVTEWAKALSVLSSARLQNSTHGTMPQWIDAWNRLPNPAGAEIDASSEAVRVVSESSADPLSLRNTLMQFHPWRKGPWELFGLKIDTEWRSNLKWERLAQSVDFQGKAILDVGCGNGYYGWKMLDAGARFVLGCDPHPLYLMQFEVFRRYAQEPECHFVVPLADSELPQELALFDISLSMGVLYHRSSPIDHLQTMWRTLRPGGQLVLETLIIDSAEKDVLVPEKRYAKMRNVWFIPSVDMLKLWLRRTGFDDIRVASIEATTPHEQRKTEWMHFESLSDFLDPKDPGRTWEGYPGPIRAIVTARRRK